jgi:hypothetical protein
MELLDCAVAVKVAGALGSAGAFTTMDVDAVFVAPPLSVTVNLAVYVPGVEYTWAVVTPVPTVPSPNAQFQERRKPSMSYEPDPSKFTVRGAVPDEGVAVMTATGTVGTPMMPISAMFEYAEAPPELEARTRYR